MRRCANSNWYLVPFLLSKQANSFMKLGPDRVPCSAYAPYTNIYQVNLRLFQDGGDVLGVRVMDKLWLAPHYFPIALITLIQYVSNMCTLWGQVPSLI